MNNKKIIVIALFVLTIILGVSAIYIGIRLQQQTTAPIPAKALTVNDGHIVNMSGQPINDNGVIGTSHNGQCSSTDGVDGKCNDTVPTLNANQTYIHIYYCAANTGIECGGSGQTPFAQEDFGSSGNTEVFMHTLVDSHQTACLIQMDVFKDTGSGPEVVDFIVWRATSCTTPTTPPSSCPVTDVNTEFWMHTDAHHDAPGWLSGNNINITTVPVRVDINCFANGGAILLPGGNVELSLNGTLVHTFNQPDPRDFLLSDAGHYSARCFIPASPGGVCENTDSFDLTGGPTTPPPTTVVPTTVVPTTLVPTTRVPPTTVVPGQTTVVPPTTTVPPVTTVIPSVTTTVPATGTTTPTVPLPKTALISDEADRLIFGSIFILLGFWIYALDGHRILGNLLWNRVGGIFDADIKQQNQDKQFRNKLLDKNRNKKK